MKGIKIIASLIMVLLLAGSCMQQQNNNQSKETGMKITKSVFGRIDSAEVYLFSLTNRSGMQVDISNYGGIVTSIMVNDKSGNAGDVVLGFDRLQDYLDGHPYFGSIVGRYGNRIANGKFSIDGTEYTLAQNNGSNHLHGGIKGFDKVIWNAKAIENADSLALELTYTSPDMEEGYPGTLKVSVTYVLTNDNELKIHYYATTDKPTPVNLTHHSYFNLSASDQNALDHVLSIDADSYVFVDETLIPTGELRSLDNTPMDFRNPAPIGSRIDLVEGGYDHTYVLNNGGMPAKVADAWHPSSGRFLEVYTTEPGIQFYSGNFLDGSLSGKNGIVYNKHHGFCLETQHFPDSPNQPGFPETILKPGEEYTYTSIYKFSIK